MNDSPPDKKPDDTELITESVNSDADGELISNDWETGDTIDRETAFAILQNRRRREVFHNLRSINGQVPLGDLATDIAAEENDSDASSVTSKERKRVYVGLYQFHLPKMDNIGVVDFNKDRGLVELTDAGREMLKRHDRRVQEDRPWAWLYLAAAGAGFILYGASLLSNQLLFIKVAFSIFCLLISGLAVVHWLSTDGADHTLSPGGWFDTM